VTRQHLTRQERELVRQLVSERVRVLAGDVRKEYGPPIRARCVYCGKPTRRKNPPACDLHVDLPAIDDHYRR
jgi:hypothetical protein